MSLACVWGECSAGFPGEWAVCLDAGEGPATEGELGQFLCTGEGMARLALVNGEPTSKPVKNIKTVILWCIFQNKIKENGNSTSTCVIGNQSQTLWNKPIRLKKNLLQQKKGGNVYIKQYVLTKLQISIYKWNSNVRLQRRHTQNNNQCSVQQSWGPEYSSVLWRYFIKCPIICAYPGVPWIRRQDWACVSLVRRGRGPAQRHWSQGRGRVAGGYQGSPHWAVSPGTGCQSELWRGRGSPTKENKHSSEKLKCTLQAYFK